MLNNDKKVLIVEIIDLNAGVADSCKKFPTYQLIQVHLPSIIFIFLFILLFPLIYFLTKMSKMPRKSCHFPTIHTCNVVERVKSNIVITNDFNDDDAAKSNKYDESIFSSDEEGENKRPTKDRHIKKRAAAKSENNQSRLFLSEFRTQNIVKDKTWLIGFLDNISEEYMVLPSLLSEWTQMVPGQELDRKLWRIENTLVITDLQVQRSESKEGFQSVSVTISHAKQALSSEELSELRKEKEEDHDPGSLPGVVQTAFSDLETWSSQKEMEKHHSYDIMFSSLNENNPKMPQMFQTLDDRMAEGDVSGALGVICVTEANAWATIVREDKHELLEEKNRYLFNIKWKCLAFSEDGYMEGITKLALKRFFSNGTELVHGIIVGAEKGWWPPSILDPKLKSLIKFPVIDLIPMPMDRKLGNLHIMTTYKEFQARSKKGGEEDNDAGQTDQESQEVDQNTLVFVATSTTQKSSEQDLVLETTQEACRHNDKISTEDKKKDHQQCETRANMKGETEHCDSDSSIAEEKYRGQPRDRQPHNQREKVELASSDGPTEETMSGSVTDHITGSLGKAVGSTGRLDQKDKTGKKEKGKKQPQLEDLPGPNLAAVKGVLSCTAGSSQALIREQGRQLRKEDELENSDSSSKQTSDEEFLFAVSQLQKNPEGLLLEETQAEMSPHSPMVEDIGNKEKKADIQIQRIIPALKGVECRAPASSPVLTHIRTQLLQQIQSRLAGEGRRLVIGETGPVLVVVNQCSRIGSDIKRDIQKTGLKDGPFFLLIVKPTRKHEEFYAVPKTLVTGKREGAGIFFMHINVSSLHECKQNENSFDSLQEYLMRF